MDAAGGVVSSASPNDVAGELEEESNNVDSLEVVSSSGDVLQEIQNAGEVLTRAELDLACSSEKLINLNLLLMHVATRESDFEAFLSEKDPIGDSCQKVLEFDLLSGFLDSEVNELDNFVSTLQMEIMGARGTVASCEHLGETFKEMEAKLDDCEESLKQSLEQLSELKVQSANFQRIILASGKPNEAMDGFGNGYLSNLDTKIKMQTAEQQRHILSMLEKSLAKELDLEKKLSESKQNEELLNLRLQEETYFMEEEAEAAWGRLFRAENLAEVLLSSSKELSARLQIGQFSLKGSAKREEDLRSKLQDHSAQLQAKDCTVDKHQQTIVELRKEVKLLEDKQKVTMLELQKSQDSNKGNQDLSSKINELENVNNHLKDKYSEVEKRAETAEAECKLLREANMDLTTKLSHLRSHNTDASNRIEQLEKKLMEADIQLQHAVASAEASEENQTMLHSMIKDMENLIADLKSKVLKAESQTDNAEEKCIILSESNAYLNEELNFMRGRMERLEAALCQANETKKATAKEISTRTQLITDLVVQLGYERERLHKQIYSLRKDKMVLGTYLRKMAKDFPVTMSEDGKDSCKPTESFMPDISSAASPEESKDNLTDFSTTSSEQCNASRNVSEHENVRNIDAWQLNFKYVLVSLIVLLSSAAAAFWSKYQNPEL